MALPARAAGRPGAGPAPLRAGWPLVAALCALASLAPGCLGSIAVPNYPEGEEVLRAGPRGMPDRPVEPLATTEAIRTLAILTPPDEPAYIPQWHPRAAFRDTSAREGAGVGFWAGLNLIASLPFFLATPAVVGGIMGISTIVGGLAGAAEAGKGTWKPTADHQALEAALARVRPEAQVREHFREFALQATGGRALMVARPADVPRNEPVDYGSLARAAGADAVADLRVVAFGVAGGEAAFTLAAFAGVRARVFRAADGVLIYDKVVAQGPDRPLAEAPPPGSYSLDLLALDEARVFRHEVDQALRGIARAIAADPDLRLTAR